MEPFKNTLYINTPYVYLSLNGETVSLSKDKQLIRNVPLHNIQYIVIYDSAGISPQLIQKCIDNNIDICCLDSHGNFMYRPIGKIKGNVLLRKQQYRISDNPEQSLNIAKNMILGKIFNSKYVVNRMARDHKLRIDTKKFKDKSEILHNAMISCKNATSMDELRGIEGESASVYFSLFDDMILQNKEDFYFHGRNKHPALDSVNALLSFTYMHATRMCTSALECVGLDPYVGFMHTDRPGRCSLALDLVEEFRAMCDKFVLSLINNKVFSKEDFYQGANGSVLLTDGGRRKYYDVFRNDMLEKLKHPFIQENVSKGQLPYVQAQLLARYIRGDLDQYPPFKWK